MTPAAPWGVVLVPTEEGRALLADAPCGGRPPAVRWMPRMDGGRGRWIEPAASRGGGPGSVIALPLWWDHAPVPEGWDRARRVLASYNGSCDDSVLGAKWYAPPIDDVLLIARVLEADRLCRVVVLE